MPYLNNKFREEIEKECEIEKLCAYFSSLDPDDLVGAVNYVVFKIARRYKPKSMSYAKAVAFIGTIECAKQEIYRRIVAPYEDKKIVENGDVL